MGIVQGNALWRSKIDLEMEEKIYSGKKYSIYKNLPDSPYQSLVLTAERFPEKTGIYDNEEREYTYIQFLKMVDNFAAYLKNVAGGREGMHIAQILNSTIEFCVSFYAINKIGAVMVPIPNKYKRQEITALLENSDASIIISDEAFLLWMNDYKRTHSSVKLIVSRDSRKGYGFEYLLSHPVMDSDCCDNSNNCTGSGIIPEKEAILMFTSGTTSQSKGVVLTNFNIMNAVCTYKKILEVTPDDITIIATPIYHITGVVALLGLFVYVGACVFLQRVFDAVNVLKCIEDKKVTFIHAPPIVFSKLLEYKESFLRLPSLRIFACGSSNMPKEKIRELHRWLPQVQFRTVYGLTETTSPAAIFDMDAAKSPNIGSSGLPVPGTEFKIVNDNGKELEIGEIGEIMIRGTVVLKEYYQRPLEGLDDDHWLATGDLGYFNKDGYLFIVDRKKDMINRGGEKIWNYDVENEFYRLPGVIEAAIVGIPDAVYGEIPAAVVKAEKNAGLTSDNIRAQLADCIAKYKIPAKILFVDQVPLTPNGKVDKIKIKTLFK